MAKPILNEQFERMRKIAGLLTENEESVTSGLKLNLTDESNWNILYGPGGHTFQIQQIRPKTDPTAPMGDAGRKNRVGLDINVSERKNQVTIAGDAGNSVAFVKIIDGMFNSGASRIKPLGNTGAMETFITLDQLDQLAPGLYERDEVTESMKPTKTTKKSLTAQIKEMILAEMNVDMSDDNKFYDFYNEVDSSDLKEADTNPGVKKVEDAIKSGKIKPEEVKSAAEKAMKGDSTALAMMMAGIGPMFEMVGESEYDTMSDSELIELANDEGMEDMIVRDGEGGLANRQEIINVLKGYMNEAKKSKKDKEEKSEEAPEEMDAELDTEVDTEIPMDTPEPSHTDVQKELTDALEAAKASGDEKLVRQIGNALTYFTRSQVAGEEGNMGGLNESFVKKMQRTAGIIK